MTVLVVGQAGVDALLPVAKVLKIDREDVRATIVMKRLTRQNIVNNMTVLVSGQVGVDALLLVVKVLKLAKEDAKEVTVLKTSKKAKNVAFNHV